MKKIKKIFGPYVSPSGRTEGRKYLSVNYDDGSRGTMLYSRYLMQEKIGRILDVNETVDHIDEDPTNDSIDNLQILSRSDNSKKSFELRGAPAEVIEITCSGCGKIAIKLARNIRGNKKKGRGGPYCSRSCAGTYSSKVDRKSKFEHGTLVAYQYNKCRCDLCRAKNAEVKRIQRKKYSDSRIGIGASLRN